MLTTDQPDDTSSSDGSSNSQQATLEELIATMATQSDFLHHRLDSMQRLLDQGTFEFSSRPLILSPFARTNCVRDLLEQLGVKEEGLTMEPFLRALNRWLVHQDLVDLNDLQILLTPFVASVFQTPAGLKKIPYCLLLTSLPNLFM